jgi:RNA-directed DNA polymerase
MSNLAKLKAATSLDDVAKILGYKPSSLSFLLYILPSTAKYASFTIAKKGGGSREISAPDPRLKTLQRHLSNLLLDCQREINKANGTSGKPLAHGFVEDYSIATNAFEHTKRRYVLNLDLKDFFPSFNFGRIRGFFTRNRDYALNEKVATILAQIACHDNQLPQGSPCSPVISNLITHVLDVRLAQLAKKNRCRYSRYADDLTFSTNQNTFPSELAVQLGIGDWGLSDTLTRVIGKAGFTINASKTRMQTTSNRQVVTGLTVNRKVNINSDYYRYARSMCHELFKTGAYRRPLDWETTPTDPPEEIHTLNVLEGVLSFICQIKNFSDPRDQLTRKGVPSSTRLLHRKFLNYKYFVAPDKPLILCEGKTDNVYLKCAIQRSSKFKPKFYSPVDGIDQLNLKFFHYSQTTQDVMLLGGGTGDFVRLIQQYQSMIAKYPHCPMDHPVIVVIDNDEGATGLFKMLPNSYGVSVSHSSSSKHYKIFENLYLVKTPEGGGPKGYSSIEDLFDSSVTSRLLSNKPFDRNKEHGDSTSYGKQVFAEKVVKAEVETIDFSKFDELLDRMSSAIDDYYAS